jgi:hypothetical protein
MILLSEPPLDRKPERGIVAIMSERSRSVVATI